MLEFARGRVLARAGARFQALLDVRVFDSVLRRSVVPAERARPNTAARDLDSIRTLLSGPAPFALFDVPWTPIFLATIFVFHPMLGFVATAGGVLLVVLALLNQMRSRRPNAESSIVGAEAENFGESLRQNAEVVQGLGMREIGIARWEALRRRAMGTQLLASDRTASYTSSSKALRFYLQSMLLAVGAWLVLQQEISAGMMIAGSILMGRALAPIEQAIGQWALLQRAVKGWKSLSELLEKTPPEAKRTELPAPRGFIRGQEPRRHRAGRTGAGSARDQLQHRPGTGAGRDRAVRRGQDHARQGADRRSGRPPAARCGSTARPSTNGVPKCSAAISAICRRRSACCPGRWRRTSAGSTPTRTRARSC